MKKEIPLPVVVALIAIVVVIAGVLVAGAVRPEDASKVKPDDYKYDPPMLGGGNKEPAPSAENR